MSVLTEAHRASNILESLENYARADEGLDGSSAVTAPNLDSEEYVQSDSQFWSLIGLTNARLQSVHITDCFLSEWVARVPGLYWNEGSEQLRAVGEHLIESRSDRWVTFSPPGKSDKVLGGVGTIRLAPDDKTGNRIVSLCCGLNASAGIPALVTADVWDQLSRGPKGADGLHVRAVRGKWKQMDHEWTQRFPNIRGIKKGYVVIDNVDDFETWNEYAPVQFHPFSIMEYADTNGTIFHDYVFAGADLGNENWRQNLESFFDHYKSANERYGRYVIAADTSEPLFDSDYRSPAELRAELELIEARVRDRIDGDETIEAVLRGLGQSITGRDELIRFSDEISLPPSSWLTEGMLTQQISSFVNEVRRRDGKIEELLQLMIKETPSLLDTPE